MIPSASPLALIARAAPLGDAASGQDALAQGDTGFSALFAGLMPGGNSAAAQPDAQALATLPQIAKAAKLAAAGGKLPQPATETGKKLPLALPETETGETGEDAELKDPALDPAAQLALAFTPPVLLALAEPITVASPQAVSVQQMVASQAAAGAAAPVAASAGFTPQPVAEAGAANHSAAPVAVPAAQDAPAQPAVTLSLAPEPVPATTTTPALAEARPIALATASQLQLQMQALPVAEGKPARPAVAAPAVTAETVEAVAPAQDKPVAASPMPQINAMAARQQKSGDRAADTSGQPATPLPTADAASPASPAASASATAFAATAPAALAAPVHAPAASTATQHAQDVARIIDQLAAARDALAPATAALTIDHAEFGELSLRIDQRADGALAVQLAAANPEAHRAVTAAIGAQGGGNTGNGQFTQADSQQGNQSAQGNAPSANGNSADRNTRGGNAQGRQDQPSQQPRNPTATTGSEPQSGTFA